MIRVYLIRHSYTEGNLFKRYIGRTDEPLCEEGIRLLQGRCYPVAEKLVVSPMHRCIQSAELIYPNQSYEIVEDLRECDFGLFENKNYKELDGNEYYQRWIDSMGTLPFPEGESREEFRERTLAAFQRVVEQCLKEGCSSVAFVIHGGSIMNIMENCALPKGSYYDYQVKNGDGYELYLENEGRTEKINWKQISF